MNLKQNEFELIEAYLHVSLYVFQMLSIYSRYSKVKTAKAIQPKNLILNKKVLDFFNIIEMNLKTPYIILV